MIARSTFSSPLARLLLGCVVALGLWVSGCAATVAPAAGPIPAVERAWPAPLVSAWPSECLAPQVEKALADSHALDVVATSLERWALEQGGRAVERTLHEHLLAVPRYALIEVTESGRGIRPIRHYVLLFERTPSETLMRAAKAEVYARVRGQRYSDGEAYVHGITPTGALTVSDDPIFGGSSLAQLALAWALAEDAESGPSGLASTDPSMAASPISEVMQAKARQWERYWFMRRVPMRGTSALPHFDALLEMLGAEQRGEASSMREMSEVALVDDESFWIVAGGAWLGERIREACATAAWVEGEAILSDFPALVSPTGFRARPGSFVRGRLTGDDLRSAYEYFSAAVDGCQRL